MRKTTIGIVICLNIILCLVSNIAYGSTKIESIKRDIVKKNKVETYGEYKNEKFITKTIIISFEESIKENNKNNKIELINKHTNEVIETKNIIGNTNERYSELTTNQIKLKPSKKIENIENYRIVPKSDIELINNKKVKDIEISTKEKRNYVYNKEDMKINLSLNCTKEEFDLTTIIEKQTEDKVKTFEIYTPSKEETEIEINKKDLRLKKVKIIKEKEDGAKEEIKYKEEKESIKVKEKIEKKIIVEMKDGLN